MAGNNYDMSSKIYLTIPIGEEDAYRILGRNCISYRVVKRDGKYYPVTRDYIEDRVNLHIENNEVIEAYLG